MRLWHWIATVAAAGVLVGAVEVAQAQPVEKGALGVGIVLGEPTGIAAKLYLADDTAIAAAAGFAFIDGGLHLSADYLLHPWLLEEAEAFVLPAYIGGGVRFLNEDRGGGNDVFHLGVRAVVGMLFDFTEIPLDAFVEIAGVFDYAFTDDSGGFGVDLNAGLGARFYF